MLTNEYFLQKISFLKFQTEKTFGVLSDTSLSLHCDFVKVPVTGFIKVQE